MFRLGIVGSDSYHAVAFAQICNTARAGPQRRDARVAMVCGDDPARTAEVARLGKIPKVVATPGEMIGRIDAALILDRHGGLHAGHAIPFLEAGVPTWVDKPFALTSDDARAMLDAASRTGTPVTSFSTLRCAGCTRRFQRKLEPLGRLITGSISGANHGAGAPPQAYGGLPFYGCHVVELMGELFGTGVVSVQASRHGTHILATARFDDERVVNLQFLGDVEPAWHVTAYAAKGSAHYQVDTRDCYRRAMGVILRMARTGRRPLSDEQMLQSVRVMEMIAEALGREERPAANGRREASGDRKGDGKGSRKAAGAKRGD